MLNNNIFNHALLVIALIAIVLAVRPEQESVTLPIAEKARSGCAGSMGNPGDPDYGVCQATHADGSPDNWCDGAGRGEGHDGNCDFTMPALEDLLAAEFPAIPPTTNPIGITTWMGRVYGGISSGPTELIETCLLYNLTSWVVFLSLRRCGEVEGQQFNLLQWLQQKGFEIEGELQQMNIYDLCFHLSDDGVAEKVVSCVGYIAP